MSKSVLASVPALMLLLAQAASAQAPRSVAQVPVFPGAREVEREGKEGVSLGGSEEEAILDGGRVVYEVGAEPDAVLRWYVERLGAAEGGPDGAAWGVAEEWPAAGSATPVHYWVYPHDIHRPGDAMVVAGAEIRKMLVEAGRTPFRPDEWVAEAELGWAHTEPSGQHGNFLVRLSDHGADAAERVTRIELQWQTFLSGDQAREHLEELEDEDMDRTLAERMGEMGASGPSAAELGVPLYPGATFDAQSSAGMSLGEDERHYIYLSADPIEKVVAFYESKTGRKAEKTDEAAWVLAIEGQIPFPRFGIYFQSGLPLPPPTRTVITVRRAQ